METNIKKCIVEFINEFNTSHNISRKYNIIFTYHRTADLKTNAYYIPNKFLIKIYIKNRQLADILRSIAHELTHYLQDTKNMLNTPHQDIGGKIENQANAFAGSFVKRFGYNHPEFNIYDTYC